MKSLCWKWTWQAPVLTWWCFTPTLILQKARLWRLSNSVYSSLYPCPYFDDLKKYAIDGNFQITCSPLAYSSHVSFNGIVSCLIFKLEVLNILLCLTEFIFFSANTYLLIQKCIIQKYMNLSTLFFWFECWYIVHTDTICNHNLLMLDTTFKKL